MKKEKIHRCLCLTEQILIEHYAGIHKELYQHIDNNCLWIGSCSNEYYTGKEKIIEMIESEKAKLPLIYLTAKEFKCVSHDRESCLIVGKYIGMTDKSSGELFRDMQRVTFYWKEKNEQLYIQHMHVSNPLHNIRDDEIFPHELGKYTQEYLNILIQKDIEKEGIIYVKDIANVIHAIYIADIVCIEALGKQTLIHVINKDIVVRMLLSEVERLVSEQNSDIMIRVHKSYMVNRFYVDHIERYELLADKYYIPVSKNRYLEITEKLHMNIDT